MVLVLLLLSICCSSVTRGLDSCYLFCEIIVCFTGEKRGFYQMVLYIIFRIEKGDSYEELLVNHPWILCRPWRPVADHVSDDAGVLRPRQGRAGVREHVWGAVSGSLGVDVPLDGLSGGVAVFACVEKGAGATEVPGG